MIDPEIEAIDPEIREAAQLKYDLANIIVNIAIARGMNIERQRSDDLYCSDLKKPISNSYTIKINTKTGKIMVFVQQWLNINVSGGCGSLSSMITEFDLTDPKCFENVVNFVEQK